MRRLIIHATNVHHGGGKTLLTALLGVVHRGYQTVAQLDSRMAPPVESAESLIVKFVKATILERFRAEWWLAKHVGPQDIVLCFGNLPPLFKLSGHVVVFVQNRYLIDDAKLDGFSLRTRLRLGVERLWLAAKMKNANEIVVQTPSMKQLLEALTKGRVPVRVLPYTANHEGYSRRMQSLKIQKDKKFDFVYVASGEPHKNHRQLIEAWCLLAKEGVFPSLMLTLDRTHFAELCSWMEQQIKNYRLHVENLGSLPHEQVLQLYGQAGALIFPSTFESFGVPLIEARQAGLPVLASELDFVRDVLDPEQTFNPESAVSIARAVKRFLGVEEQPLPLLDATQFMASILEKAE